MSTTTFDQCKLHHQTELRAKVNVNKAHKSGNMYAAGWRREYCGQGYTIGTSFTKDVRDQEACDAEVAEIGLQYQEFFFNLSPLLYEKAVEEQVKLESPSICNPLYRPDFEHGSTFGGNLSITTDHFSNIGHNDFDANKRTFGVFYPVNKDSGRLARREMGYDGVGNYFVFDDLRVAIDLNGCDGVVRVIWRSTEDVHLTSSATAGDKFGRIGTSIQINKRLDESIRKIKREGGVIEDKIRPADHRRPKKRKTT